MTPELVVFDVDGTLHDTFRWWGPVIRRGVAAFARSAGYEPILPDDVLAHAVVGMKDEDVFAPFLPPGLRHRWRELRDIVVPLECEELRSGTDYLYPGIPALLTHLRRHGIRVALASNCRQDYFTAVCAGQRLAALSDWQFCLDSAGVTSKTDMVRRAIEAAGTHRAVVVGDREPDLEAARTLDLPFWWRRNARCDLHAEADLVWDGDPEALARAAGVPGIS